MKKITMTPSSFFKEHKKLISLLRGQSKKLEKEAKQQEKEANRWRGKLR
jgi:hypothetical protein